MSATDLAAGYELAFSEARRALDVQERMASDLRSRAAVLIAAAAVVTSFFGGRMAENGLAWSGWVAVGCFCLLGVAVLVILWPRSDWQGTVEPMAIVGRLVERRGGPPSTTGFHRELVVHMSAAMAANHRELERLGVWLRTGAVLLVGEVVAWLASVATTA
jgi:hypothetical protein